MHLINPDNSPNDLPPSWKNPDVSPPRYLSDKWKAGMGPLVQVRAPNDIIEGFEGLYKQMMKRRRAHLALQPSRGWSSSKRNKPESSSSESLVSS